MTGQPEILNLAFKEIAQKAWNAAMEQVEQFINKVNKWLSHGKIPITIISFTPFTDDDNSDTAEWEIVINN